MKIKLYAVSLLASLLLAGCNGDSESAGPITINTTYNTDSANSDSEAATTGLCSQAVKADFIAFNDDCSVGTITGTVNTNYKLLEDINYILDGVVKVGEGNVEITSAAQMQAIIDAGVTLTVEPGADIKATTDGVLLVTRGSKLIADAYANKPITFSSLDAGYDGMGEWGGVIIQGFAPQYGQKNTGACFAEGEAWCNVEGEGGTDISNYGGNLPDDDSGIIRYVRIAEGGLVAGPNNEVNGLTLQGVGHATTIEYIQVHGNLDDGIEWFGGTANVKYAVLTNNDDDDIDFDEGYQGNIQYALIIKNQTPNATPVGSNDPRGIELNSSDDDYTPQTAGVIANVTIIGGDAVNYDSGVEDDVQVRDPNWDGNEFGMRLRGSVTAAIHNSAVTGYKTTCARIDDSDHDLDGTTDKIDTPITMNNFLCDTDGVTFNKEDPIDTTTVIEEAITFDSNYGITNASANVGETTIEAYDNGSGFVFDSTDFIGAVDPSATTTWYSEWVIPGSVN